MYDVTIAIPLYNAEKYIEATLLSALDQTFENIEFLIIDDCGTDSGLDIVKHLQINHPRGKDIRIVSHPYNLGLGCARNTALDNAKGKYFYFLDSDDLMDSGCIQLLYNHAVKSKSELTSASFQYYKNNRFIPARYISEKLIFNHPGEFAKHCYQIKGASWILTWNKLYDLSFLKKTNIKFHQTRRNEDLLFMFELAPHITNCILLPDITYTYNIRDNSLFQHTFRPVIPIEEIRIHQYTCREMKKYALNFPNENFTEIMFTYVMNCCLDWACVFIDKRKIISGPISGGDIKEMLRHPLPYSKIRKFKKHKFKNLFYFYLSKVPYPVLFPSFIVYFKTIKAYRKLRS